MGHVLVGEFFFPACAACRMSACAISIDKEAKQDFQQVTYLCNVVFFLLLQSIPLAGSSANNR